MNDLVVKDVEFNGAMLKKGDEISSSLQMEANKMLRAKVCEKKSFYPKGRNFVP